MRPLDKESLRVPLPAHHTHTRSYMHAYGTVRNHVLSKVSVESVAAGAPSLAVVDPTPDASHTHKTRKREGAKPERHQQFREARIQYATPADKKDTIIS